MPQLSLYIVNHRGKNREKKQVLAQRFIIVFIYSFHR